MKTPRQVGVIIPQLTLIQQTVQTVHNLYKNQIIEVDISDTIQAATGDFIPVSKLINMKVEEEYRQGQIKILKHLTKYILTKETDQVVHVFSLVLKDKDKTSPVSEALASDPNTTVSKTREDLASKDLVSDTVHKSKRKETPEYNKYVSGVIQSLSDCETLQEKLSFMKFQIEGDVEPYILKAWNNIITNHTELFEVQTASDNDEVVSDKGHWSKLPNGTATWQPASDSEATHWSKQPEHMAKKQYDTYINGIHLHKEMLSDSKTVQVDYTKAAHDIATENAIHDLANKLAETQQEIKYLNSKIDKILKLYFKDKDNN